MSMLLVENRQRVLLGPMDYRQRYFAMELSGMGISAQLPDSLDGYLKVTDSIEIFPVSSISQPEMNPMFDQPVGPYWTYDAESATATYDKIDQPVPQIRSNLKNLAAAIRYNKEVAGTTMTVQGQAVTVDTSREGRNIFVQTLDLMADGDTVGWKFPEGWIMLTKSDLASVVTAGAAHIRSQFEWEMTKSQEIDAAQTADDLRAITWPEASTAINQNPRQF